MKLREEEFYEQYHQHGGTTIIPTEIFNELYDDATEEIERLKSIIKEVREYIKQHTENIDRGRYYEDYVETYPVLEILDKALEKAIERDKKIEKIDLIDDYTPYIQFRVTANKINEIIDKINGDN